MRYVRVSTSGYKANSTEQAPGWYLSFLSGALSSSVTGFPNSSLTLLSSIPTAPMSGVSPSVVFAEGGGCAIEACSFFFTGAVTPALDAAGVAGAAGDGCGGVRLVV